MNMKNIKNMNTNIPVEEAKSLDIHEHAFLDEKGEVIGWAIRVANELLEWNDGEEEEND